MRFNIPLLPVQVSIGWRTLPPFRFTIRGTMLTVGIMAVFFASMNSMRRLGRLNRYHADQIQVDELRKQWHIDMSNKYAVAIQQVDAWVALFALAILTLLALGIVGQVLNRVRRNAERQEATGGP